MLAKNGPGAGDAGLQGDWTLEGCPSLPPITSPRQIKRADAEAAIALLVELFPRAFVIYEQRRQPLKIGIYDDIIAKTNGAIAPSELGLAMRLYCRNTGYLQAVARAAARVDLDGNPVGAVSAEQSAQAAAELKIRAQRRNKQRQQKADAAKPTPTPVTPCAIVEPEPKRLGLSDLRRAGQLRRSGVSP